MVDRDIKEILLNKSKSAREGYIILTFFTTSHMILIFEHFVKESLYIQTLRHRHHSLLASKYIFKIITR